MLLVGSLLLLSCCIALFARLAVAAVTSLLTLTIVMAILSSYQDKIIDPHTMVFGEVGLAGEVRAVSMVQQRVDEAVKLGFTTCILPRVNLARLKKPEGIRLVGIAGVGELLGRRQG